MNQFKRSSDQTPIVHLVRPPFVQPNPFELCDKRAGRLHSQYHFLTLKFGEMSNAHCPFGPRIGGNRLQIGTPLNSLFQFETF